MAFDLLAVTKDKNNKRNCLGNDKKQTKKLKPNQIKARKHTQKILENKQTKTERTKLANIVQIMYRENEEEKNEIATKCN